MTFPQTVCLVVNLLTLQTATYNHIGGASYICVSQSDFVDPKRDILCKCKARQNVVNANIHGIGKD